MKELHDMIRKDFETLEAEMVDVYKGNKSAARRARKALLDIGKITKTLRVKILESTK